MGGSIFKEEIMNEAHCREEAKGFSMVGVAIYMLCFLCFNMKGNNLAVHTKF